MMLSPSIASALLNRSALRWMNSCSPMLMRSSSPSAISIRLTGSSPATALIDISPYKFNGPGGKGQPDYVHITTIPDGYRQRVDVVRGHSVTAIGNALEHGSLFLMPVWLFLATAVAGLKLVTPDGSTLSLKRGDADFEGSVVNLGALGIVAERLPSASALIMSVDVISRVPMLYFSSHWPAALGIRGARFPVI